MKTALTIAGSDSSGGAGIQADIKTMLTNGVYAMSAVTALTAQNTQGVRGILPVPPAFLRQQMEAVFDDIRPDAVKIGMVCSPEQMLVIADCLRQYRAENVVIDPVMVSSSGTRLMDPDAVSALLDSLCPVSALLTPNLPEAELLSGQPIHTADDMRLAAERISRRCGCAVLCKGGHSSGDADDLLFTEGGFAWFPGKRIENPNSHGTGCTLSSAIAANLAKGFSLPESVFRAKEYITAALAAMLDLGAGSGPMNHGFALRGHFAGEEAAGQEKENA